MAKTVKYGSSGDDVKELQRLLNTNGYSLSEDGVFGEKTQKAVYDYQRSNGLSVDGIVGVNTWGKLSGSQSAAQPAVTPAANPAATQEVKSAYTPSGTRPTYAESDGVKSAQAAVNNWESNKPSQYSGTYQSQIDALLEKVMNGEKFNYDMNADALYQQYREQYINNGKKAMEDTAANASAYTGGYGSSYGSAAAQQAYNSYLQGLNDKVPQLEERAYNRYINEKGLDAQNLSVLQGLDATEYGRYRDNVSDYWNEGNYLSGKAQNLSDDEYSKFLQLANEYESDRNFDYQKYANELSQRNYENEFAYQKERDAVSDAQWQKEYDLTAAKASSGSSKSSGSSSSSSTIPSQILSSLKGLSNDELESKISEYEAAGILTSVQANAAWIACSSPEDVDENPDNAFIMTQAEFNRHANYVKKYGTYSNYRATMEAKNK